MMNQGDEKSRILMGPAFLLSLFNRGPLAIFIYFCSAR